jgi:hypothetical protein
MQSRRRFLRLSLLGLIAPAMRRPIERGAAQSSGQVYLPLAFAAPLAPPAAVPPSDMPLLGAASGAAPQAVSWLLARCAGEYTPYDVTSIVDAYRRLGEWAGLDWFLAIAQMAHETGSMTSWWSGRPRRNPAGIGVTGETRLGSPEAPPGPGWTWDDQGLLWRAGWSFPTWADHAIPAHLGRLLAYALTDAQANPAQRSMIDYALSFRPLPASYRGAAPTIVGLNGKWAVPGTTYGQRIIDLAWRMRQG